MLGDEMGAPRCSIIMNVRNGAATLREALESALAQTFTDWELIFWDDCSTDNSATIAAGYKDPRILYFLSPEDTPLGRARYLAMRQARGEWLAFLDQDDVWLPRKLERQMALAGDPGVGIIYGRTVRFTVHGGERDYDHRHEFLPLPEGEIFTRLFTKSDFICMSSAVLRRAAVEELGPIPADIHNIPDYYMFLGIAHRYSARVVQEVICRYRVHKDSMSHYSGRRMQQEALWLVDRYADRLDPKLAAWRRKVHSSVLAVEEILHGEIGRGMARLALRGSPGFVMSRPFVFAFRAVRRRVRQPYWLAHAGIRNVQTNLARQEVHAAAVASGGIQEQAAEFVHARTCRPHATGTTEAAGQTLTLSVIIVNWNVGDLLRDCLHSLFQQMLLPPNAWEVLVVDNNSSDGSVEMLRQEFPQVILLANHENLGFGRANNHAFARARGSYILLLNPDTVVLDHAVDGMLKLAQAEDRIAALGCRLLNLDLSFQRWTGGNPPNLLNVTCHFLLFYKVLPAAVLPKPLYLENQPRQSLEVGWVSGACMLLRREALRERLFDERFFMYGEDIELCSRLRSAGWQVVYTPEVSIIHLEGRSLEVQSPEMRLNKLRSLRETFAMRHSRPALLYYDLMVALGFTTRAMLFGFASLLGARYKERATTSRQFMAEAFRLVFQR